MTYDQLLTEFLASCRVTRTIQPINHSYPDPADCPKWTVSFCPHTRPEYEHANVKWQYACHMFVLPDGRWLQKGDHLPQTDQPFTAEQTINNLLFYEHGRCPDCCAWLTAMKEKVG